MNPVRTWLLVALTIGLFGFIVFVERRSSDAAATAGGAGQLLPNFNPALVTSVEVIFRTNQILRAERTNDDWNLVLPFKYPAYANRIDNLLEVFTQLNRQSHISAQELLAHQQPMSAFGLDPPQATLIVEQPGDRLELKVGGKAPIGDKVYVQLVGTDGIFFNDTAFLTRLPRSIDDWRDPTFLRLKGLSFNCLRMRAGTHAFELQIDPSSQLWQLTKPIVARADNLRLNSVIRQLKEWQIRWFVPDSASADLDDYGLQPPVAVLRLGQGTNDLLVVQFGKSPTNDPTRVYAQCLPSSTLVEVPHAPLDQLSVPYTAWRDPRLVPMPSSTISLIQAQAEENFSLQRQADGSWRVISPQAFQADPELVKQFLGELGGLEIVEFVKDVVTDFSDWGLAKPSRQYTLKAITPAGFTNQVQVNFGTNKDDHIYARLSNEDSVYAARLEAVRKLPVRAFQFRDRRLWNFASSNVVNVTVTIHDQTRKLVRNASQQWMLETNSVPLIGPLSAALEETLHRFGQLRAETWTDLGEDKLAKYGFPEAGHRLALQVNADGKTQVLTLDFGGLAPSQNVYAAVSLDGRKVVFELGWRLFQLYQDVLHSLSAPAAVNRP